MEIIGAHHDLWVTGGYLWCARCGSFSSGERAARGLRSDCVGKRGLDAKSRTGVNRLQAGQDPISGARIGVAKRSQQNCRPEGAGKKQPARAGVGVTAGEHENRQNSGPAVGLERPVAKPTGIQREALCRPQAVSSSAGPSDASRDGLDVSDARPCAPLPESVNVDFDTHAEKSARPQRRLRRKTAAEFQSATAVASGALPGPAARGLCE